MIKEPPPRGRGPARPALLLALLLGLTPAAGAMDLGTNFWNPGWHRPEDCFRNVREVMGENPWNPQFLEETTIFRSFRFMDWDHTNHSERRSWLERPRRDAPVQNPVAYEWMIDLCNRQGADFWLTVPHRTVDRALGDEAPDYALRLCLLVRTGVDMGAVDLAPLRDRLADLGPEDLVAAGGTRTTAPLRPDLRVYLEYSNETWNGIFRQADYCRDEGLALGLDPDRNTAGHRYHAWAALRLFHAANLVFGADSPRLVRVLATQSANPWIAGQHLAVLADPRWNPRGLRADALAVAPYFGHAVAGDDPDAVARLRDAIRKSARDTARHREIATGAGLRLIAYEGGQHVTRQAGAINRDPAMHDLYREYLAALAPHLDHFCHYAHVGRAGERGAWGALEYTGQPANEAPKYRALRDWAAAAP